MNTTRIISVVILLFSILQFSTSILDKTYFKALGILPSETNKQVIDKAYNIAKEKIINSNADKKKIDLLNEAYKVISDKTLRQKYQKYNSVAWKDLPKNTKTEEHDPRKGPLITLNVPITLQQIFNGGNITLKYTRKSACQKCQGYGFKNPQSLHNCHACKGKGYELITYDTRNGFKQTRQQPCSHCKGSGKQSGATCSSCHGKKLVNEVVDLVVPIQKGLPQGHTLILKNFGDQKQIGAPSDLKLVFKQKNDGKWRRSKFNIEHIFEISLEQAIFGVNRNITHLDGKIIHVQMNAPITPSSSLIITGQGFVSRKDKSKRGDLVIVPKIKVQSFTEQQLDIWQKVFMM